MHVRCFAKRLNLLPGGVYVHAHVLAEFLQHLKNCRQFLFRKHSDLKIQMRSPFGLARHSSLADQDEDSQEHAFERNDERQDAERKRVKGFQTGDLVRAVVTGGIKRGTYVGKVAVRTSGSFNITTTHGIVQGIPHRFCRLIARSDGYSYS